MTKLRIIFLWICVAQTAQAQVLGGRYVYDFLEMSPSARISALGGINVSISDHDLSVALANPSAWNPAMHRHASFGTAVYPGRTNFGNLVYAHKFRIPGTFGFGFQYMAYGRFQETDAVGNVTGQFSATDMNLYAGYGYQFGRIFSAGLNTKLIYSQLGPWSSFGAATDIAVMINDTARNITASLVARNAGAQIKPYTPGNRYDPPFDLQAGISFGFKGVPFRIHTTFHHLHVWDIRYNNPADEENNLFIDTAELKKRKYIADKLFRHIIIGIEFNIKKVVRLNMAYNHYRQQELRLTTRRGAPGLSFGLGVHIRQFDFTYGMMPLAQGQTLQHFTLSVNTAGFVRRVKTEKSNTTR
ncbi:MAG: type IX secretion system protein PorQ [Chitinophagales bacterium]|nr:type IX secretion system protein PorQ [Chitinophagales bacterium]MDW8419394.1 type IX secretion system protein PorQ [Chitinophagales bacterium]